MSRCETICSTTSYIRTKNFCDIPKSCTGKIRYSFFLDDASYFFEDAVLALDVAALFTAEDAVLATEETADEVAEAAVDAALLAAELDGTV